MADTIRTRADLVTILADNVTGDISPQDIRDFLVSCILRNTGSGADQYIIKPQAGDSTTFFQIQEFDSGDVVFNVDTTNKRVGILTDAPGTYCQMLSPILSSTGDAISAFNLKTSQATPREVAIGLGGLDTCYFGTLSTHRVDIVTAALPRIKVSATGQVTVAGNRFAIATVSNSLANNAAGTVGDIAIGTDTNTYLYIWFATNTPSRVEIATW